MIVLICSRIPNDFVDHLLVIQTCKSVDKIKYTMNTQQFWLLLGYLLKFCYAILVSVQAAVSLSFLTFQRM